VISWVIHGVCAPSAIGILPAFLMVSQTWRNPLQVVGGSTPASWNTFLL
jgi:hypothetical protein